METGMRRKPSEDALLIEMRDALKALVGPGSERGNKGAWSYYKKNKSWFIEQAVTFAGTTMDINLDMDMGAVQLNRVEQIFNDASARDIDLRIYANPAASTYISIYTQAGSTVLNKVIQAGSEYKFTAGTRLTLHYATYTASDTVLIRIQLDEL